MKKIILPLLILLSPSLAFAQSESAVLKDGLNMTTFKQCQIALQYCQRDLYLRPTCLQQRLYRHPECAQLSAISKLSSVDADLIDAKNEGNLSLISLRYPADGQVNYAVLSEGKLINLSVNPETVIPTLAKKYPGAQFFSHILSEPKYVVTAFGDHQFIARFRITKDCMVCETVGNVVATFEFDANGKFISTQVTNL